MKPTLVRGQAFSGTVAHFTFADPTATASDFTATINWGDGGNPDPTATIVSDAQGGFLVEGQHTYTDATPAGTPDTITVTVQETAPNGDSAQATTTATVAARR